MSSQDAVIRASTEAAKNFVDHYYQCLNEVRPTSGLYVTNNRTYQEAGHPPADICINGQVYSSPEDVDVVRRSNPTGRTTRYKVESIDAHILNPDYRFAAPPSLLAPNPSKPDQGASTKIMLMVTVSGTVTITEHVNTNAYKFNDVFRLVPNWDVIAKYGTKGAKRFLVASQTLRVF
ncbi:hypothetical protein OQA88_11454 [Cercophora sp. LCS_1]